MYPDAPARRITTWLAILGYTLVASGLPLPLGGVATPDARGAASARRVAAKDRSRPFPCMDSPCGCDTAERCFTNCCCHTPAQTLAWARAHGVEPAVLVALERRANAEPPAGTRPPAPTSRSCCTSAAPRALKSCCSTAPNADSAENPSGPDACSDRRSPADAPPATSEASVATDDDAPAGHDAPAGDEPVRQPRSRAVTLRAMLACGGIVAEWFSAGAALPPPRFEVAFVTILLDACPPADEAGEGLRGPPAAPPPRVA